MFDDIGKKMSFLDEKRMVWLGIFLGGAFWFIEAAIHTYIFNGASYYAELLHPEEHEVWMRMLVVSLFIGFGFYSQRIIKKFETAQKNTNRAYRELDQIFNTAADGMRVVNKDFIIIRANDTFLNLAGVSREEAIGHKCYEIFSGPTCNTSQCTLKLILSGKNHVEYSMERKRRDGRMIPCIVTATPFRSLEGEILGIVEDFKDITEYKESRDKLEKLNQELLEANEKLEEITLIDSHTGLYNYRYLNKMLESEFIRSKRHAYPLSLLMMDIDYFKSINDVYGHQFGDLVLKQFALQLKKMVRQYDSVIRFGGEEFIIIFPGIDKTSVITLCQRLLDTINRHNFGDDTHRIKVKSSIAIVSFPEDRITQSMDLINLVDKILHRVKEDGGNKVYSSLDLNKEPSSLNDTSKQSTEVDYLKNKIDKLTRRANQSVIEAVFAFTKTIELKDHYTGEHVEDTVRYATKIARALDLPKKEVEKIGEAAILHDLGKIGISENILNKKDKLSYEEFEEIKRHPQIGVDIIRPIQSLQEIIPLVLYHHEKWNGKNSIFGLKGEEIPIGARIVAIADVYQALISDRPYRKAFIKEDAVKMIKEFSGTQFDPNIVDVFLNVLQEEE